MLKSARHAQIHELVTVNGHVTVQELNQLLNVSEATVRRDLGELSKAGRVRRTHGGALRVEKDFKELPTLQRRGEQQEEKQRIGRLAAEMVKSGQTIFLGSGSTVHEIARNLQDIPSLVVITNALNVVNQLLDNDNIELVVIGGMLRPNELSMVGHIAEAAIKELRADKVFMGMYGVDPHHGFTGSYFPEAITDRTILGIAPHNIIVVDHCKLGSVGAVFLADINAAQVLITGREADPEHVTALQEREIDVRLA
jgi:DeoR family transcriptional regulator, aga operon transcriptional repressor